jgi:hypothetical protein
MIDASRIAGELAAAERDRRHRQPFTDEYPELGLETAYAAQWAGIQAKLGQGQRLVGAKLGPTSRAKQGVMNVDPPLYGLVTRGMLAPYGEPVVLIRAATAGHRRSFRSSWCRRRPAGRSSTSRTSINIAYGCDNRGEVVGETGVVELAESNPVVVKREVQLAGRVPADWRESGSCAPSTLSSRSGSTVSWHEHTAARVRGTAMRRRWSPTPPGRHGNPAAASRCRCARNRTSTRRWPGSARWAPTEATPIHRKRGAEW